MPGPYARLGTDWVSRTVGGTAPPLLRRGKDADKEDILARQTDTTIDLDPGSRVVTGRTASDGSSSK